MSLVVLKRKSAIKNSKISSQKGYFSLNNPRRVGSHTNKIQTQTPMKGNVPRGHGSCCDNYPVNISKSQYNNYDPHVREFNGDKSNTAISVKNNHSSISTRNKWLKRGYPHFIVKDIGDKSYDNYLKQKREQSASKNFGRGDIDGFDADNETCCQTTSKAGNIVQHVETKDYGEYLRTNFLNKHCLPTPNSMAHYPVPMSGACATGGEAGTSDVEKGNCG